MERVYEIHRGAKIVVHSDKYNDDKVAISMMEIADDKVDYELLSKRSSNTEAQTIEESVVQEEFLEEELFEIPIEDDEDIDEEISDVVGSDNLELSNSDEEDENYDEDIDEE